MTPKEEAEELINKFMNVKWTSGSYKRQKAKGLTSYGVAKSSQRQMTREAAIESALVVVNRILEFYWTDVTALAYWKEVKSELQKQQNQTT